VGHQLRGPGALLGTTLGRRHLRYAACDRAGPLMLSVAALYRRTVVRHGRIVAIVGSFGKTTTTRAVQAALGGSSTEPPGANSGGWVALALLRLSPRSRHGVIEVGINGPGQMEPYARTIRPNIAVVTSVGSEHNRTLRTLEATRHEKAAMVRVLPPSGLAVLNGDDPNVLWMSGETQARVVTFGFGDRNDVRAADVAIQWPHGTRFTVHTPTGSRKARIRLIGETMVRAALAAVAVAVNEGEGLHEVIGRLETLAPTPGRLEPVLLPNGAMLLRDEFKAPVETIDAALDVMREIPAARRVIVMGDVAEPVGSQRELYRRLGARTARVSSRAISLATGDLGAAFRVGATQGGLPAEAVAMVGRSVRRAAEALAADLAPGDVVLIKGRDTQRLERVALALAGRDVRCELVYCNARLTRCDACPMLGRSWAGLWRDERASRRRGPEAADAV
jgi:UDP-N-acetylmuramyl pentapeptide synthase